MVSLLHALSLLQNAIRSGRLAHFQPSTACMISCVRSILAATGCLSRDAVALRRYTMLAEQRKRILSDLASLVAQAKAASAGNLNGMKQAIESDALMRLGGRVFARVRRFLVFAVQCGVELPEADEDNGSTTCPSSATEGGRRPLREPTVDDADTSNDDAEPDEDDTYRRKTPVIARTADGAAHRPVIPRFQTPNSQATPRAPLRTKSMGDLRNNKATADATSPTSRHIPPKPLRPAPPIPSHQRGPSLSSMSSSSSVSSVESIKTPATLQFPNGPCTVAEVIEALRNTHDQYLSIIAAFIGHVHSHSRTSHASSTGHILELVREVVEMVCRLLTIVDGVMKHPGIPTPKILNLKTAKHGLYNITSSLAESVRILTSGASGEGRSEEDERAGLLKLATDASKAGNDCVNEVKKCLLLSVVDEPIILQLPIPGKLVSDTLSAPKGPEYPHQESQNVSKLPLEIDEDATVQGDLLPLVSPQQPFVDNEESIINEEAALPPEIPPGGRDSACSVRSAPGRKIPPPPLVFTSEPVAPALPSPVSFARTDDDGTTWEGSHNLHGRPSQDTARSGSTTSRYAKGEIDNRLLLSHDYSLEDVAYNKDGVLVGASLECLVEKMTPHNNIVEPAFSAVFFMTFRMFSTPQELVAMVIRRYNLLPPEWLSNEDLHVWQQRKGVPVRLRVANFLKLWLETYWRSVTDDMVLGSLMAFTRDALAVMFPNPSQRVMELIILRSQQTNTIISPRADRSKDAGMPLNPPSAGLSSDIPRPIMTKTLLTQLRARGFNIISPLDFDALELARQLTIVETRLYCAITAEEVLEAGKEVPRGVTAPNPNVKAVTSLSTTITGWVAETILDETDTKKRTALVKFFIKLADVCFSHTLFPLFSNPIPQRCNTLNNFSTSRAILAALDSSTISRLQQTWTGLSQKYKLQLEGLRKLADHARNYSEYRGRLRNTSPPAVPFLGKNPCPCFLKTVSHKSGLYLTDLTFCREGNPSTRPSPIAPEKKLINFNKYHKLARIVQGTSFR